MKKSVGKFFKGPRFLQFSKWTKLEFLSFSFPIPDSNFSLFKKEPTNHQIIVTSQNTVHNNQSTSYRKYGYVKSHVLQRSQKLLETPPHGILLILVASNMMLWQYNFKYYRNCVSFLSRRQKLYIKTAYKNIVFRQLRYLEIYTLKNLIWFN